MGDEAPKAVLSGELIPSADATRSQRQRYTANLDDDTVAQIIRERVAGRTLRELSEQYGVSTSTITKWMSDAHAVRKGRSVADIRAALILEAEAVASYAWEIARTVPDPRTVLDALLRVESTIRTRSALAGANEPIRRDITVNVVTDQERELQEMIAIAKAQIKLRETAVINAATDDEEL